MSIWLSPVILAPAESAMPRDLFVYNRPLNSHDLVVRHTISLLISRLLVNLTISHDLAEILLLLCA